EVGDLVALGVPEPDRRRVLDYLWTLAGGHPHLAQYLLESMPLPIPFELDQDGDKAVRDCVTRLRSFVRTLDELSRNGARQLAHGTIPATHIGDALVDAGLARHEEGRLVVNGDIVRRALLADAAEVEADPPGIEDAAWMAAILRAGEGPGVEFKESVKWDIRRQVEDDALKYEVPQAIAAFLNSDGGSLLLGVADDGSLTGLAPDMALVRRTPRSMASRSWSAIFSVKSSAALRREMSTSLPQRRRQAQSSSSPSNQRQDPSTQKSARSPTCSCG
ncbi:MAG: ATP-binding protein, partial [Chloroflexota bacterium]